MEIKIRKFQMPRCRGFVKKLSCFIVFAAVFAAYPARSQRKSPIINLPSDSLTISSGRPVMMTDRPAARFLDQATWGPTPNSIVQLQRMDIPSWLDWQFSLNLSDIPDQPI